jgi:phosphatidylethanolamine/phosphatidyl-N-methylethanolamine N-methyltransferase
MQIARRERDRLFTKFREEVRFLRNWAGNPLTTGAVAPSGKPLARLMASFIEPRRPGKVLELGPGTGVVTQAMIERGIPPEKIVSVEYSGDFVALMRGRFPGVNVVRGDAYAIEPQAEFGTDRPLASVVSSLPLFSRPPHERRALLNRALDMLEPGAPFIQFSYALFPPVKPEPGAFETDVTDWIVRNVPPARVWIYRRPA